MIENKDRSSVWVHIKDTNKFQLLEYITPEECKALNGISIVIDINPNLPLDEYTKVKLFTHVIKIECDKLLK